MEPRIRENSLIASLAARIMKADRIAIVVGKTIHLHSTTKADFLSNARWVNHEMAHIRQFARYGFFSFIIKYLWESLKSGYWNNKYEVEARAAENQRL